MVVSWEIKANINIIHGLNKQSNYRVRLLSKLYVASNAALCANDNINL